MYALVFGVGGWIACVFGVGYYVVVLVVSNGKYEVNWPPWPPRYDLISVKKGEEVNKIFKSQLKIINKLIFIRITSALELNRIIFGVIRIVNLYNSSSSLS